MAKWYGTIGFAMTVEDPPDSGNWKEKVVEKKYRGELTYQKISYEQGESINDNLALTNDISIIADSFLHQNAYAIKYVSGLGGYWKVRNITESFPRLVLSIGGVYNGRISEQSGTGEEIVPTQPSETDTGSETGLPSTTV